MKINDLVTITDKSQSFGQISYHDHLEGRTGKIVGLSGFFEDRAVWIVLLDTALPSGVSAVCVGEAGLLVNTTIIQPTVPNYPIPAYPAPKPEDKDWWDQFQRDAWKDPNPIVGQCAKCKRDIRHIELFSCGTYDCPIQPKVWF